MWFTLCINENQNMYGSADLDVLYLCTTPDIVSLDCFALQAVILIQKLAVVLSASLTL